MQNTRYNRNNRYAKGDFNLKLNCFNKRLVAINQKFTSLNIKGVNAKKTRGVLWHKRISGRKDQNVTNSCLKSLEFIHFLEFSTVKTWLNNCSGQNKCWTFFRALVHFVNMVDLADTIKLKYFTAGHTFMSVSSVY